MQKAQDEARALPERSARLLAERNAATETRSPAASEAAPLRRAEERLALQALVGKLTALEGQAGGGFGGGRGAAPDGPETLASIVGTLNQLMGLLQGADVTPTTQLVSAVAERRAALNKLLAQWTALKAEARTRNLVIE